MRACSFFVITWFDHWRWRGEVCGALGAEPLVLEGRIGGKGEWQGCQFLGKPRETTYLLRYLSLSQVLYYDWHPPLHPSDFALSLSLPQHQDQMTFQCRGHFQRRSLDRRLHQSGLPLPSQQHCCTERPLIWNWLVFCNGLREQQRK